MGNVGQGGSFEAAVLAIGRMDYGPMRVDKRAKEAAIEFLQGLQRRNAAVPAPDVGPSPDRGVGMAWLFATSEGELEIEVVFLDWGRIEYREGFAERDGFVEQTMLDDPEQLHERLARAARAAHSPA